MSPKRSILVALATMFVAIAAPAAHAQVGYGLGPTGCGGGCGAVAYAPILYAQPIAPAHIYVNSGCGNCGVPVSPCCAAPVVQAPTPIFGGWGGDCGGCAAPIASCCAAPVPVAPCCGIPAVYAAPAPVYMSTRALTLPAPASWSRTAPMRRRRNTRRRRAIRRTAMATTPPITITERRRTLTAIPTGPICPRAAEPVRSIARCEGPRCGPSFLLVPDFS